MNFRYIPFFISQIYYLHILTMSKLFVYEYKNNIKLNINKKKSKKKIFPRFLMRFFLKLRT